MSYVRILPPLNELLTDFVKVFSGVLKVPLTYRLLVTIPNRYGWSTEDGYADGVSCLIEEEGTVNCVAGFKITLLPGNDTAAIVSECWVLYEEQGKGVGSSLHQLRLTALEKAGVKLMICTVNSYNSRQLRIVEKHGWSKAAEFSSATDSLVFLYTKTL